MNKTTNGRNRMQKPTRVRGAKRIEMILQGLNAGKSQRKIADELGVDEGTVTQGSQDSAAS